MICSFRIGPPHASRNPKVTVVFRLAIKPRGAIFSHHSHDDTDLGTNRASPLRGLWRLVLTIVRDGPILNVRCQMQHGFPVRRPEVRDRVVRGA